MLPMARVQGRRGGGRGCFTPRGRGGVGKQHCPKRVESAQKDQMLSSRIGIGGGISLGKGSVIHLWEKSKDGPPR